MKFIHVSDLHYHRYGDKNQDADALLKILKARYPDHGLIVTGDITDDGHPLQYKNAFKVLEPFKGKVFVAPGNHDYGVIGSVYSRERALRFDEMLSGPLDQGDTFNGENKPVVNWIEESGDRILLIALDSNLETDSLFDFACGEVGEVQLAALDKILSNPANEGSKKLLFLHHHPFIHNHPIMELKDAKKLFRVIYGRIDVLLFGHKHESRRWDDTNGIPIILAADNSPGKDWAREIAIENGTIKVQDVSIKPVQGRKKSGK